MEKKDLPEGFQEISDFGLIKALLGAFMSSDSW
jgi:hypothetical protein